MVLLLSRAVASAAVVALRRGSDVAPRRHEPSDWRRTLEMRCSRDGPVGLPARLGLLSLRYIAPLFMLDRRTGTCARGQGRAREGPLVGQGAWGGTQSVLFIQEAAPPSSPRGVWVAMSESGHDCEIGRCPRGLTRTGTHGLPGGAGWGRLGPLNVPGRDTHGGITRCPLPLLSNSCAPCTYAGGAARRAS